MKVIWYQQQPGQQMALDIVRGSEAHHQRVKLSPVSCGEDMKGAHQEEAGLTGPLYYLSGAGYTTC